MPWVEDSRRPGWLNWEDPPPQFVIVQTVEFTCTVHVEYTTRIVTTVVPVVPAPNRLLGATLTRNGEAV